MVVVKNITIYKPGLSGFINNIENSFHQMKYILTSDERKDAKGKKGKELEHIFANDFQSPIFPILAHKIWL